MALWLSPTYPKCSAQTTRRLWFCSWTECMASRTIAYFSTYWKLVSCLTFRQLSLLTMWVEKIEFSWPPLLAVTQCNIVRVTYDFTLVQAVNDEKYHPHHYSAPSLALTLFLYLHHCRLTWDPPIWPWPSIDTYAQHFFRWSPNAHLSSMVWRTMSCWWTASSRQSTVSPELLAWPKLRETQSKLVC